MAAYMRTKGRRRPKNSTRLFRRRRLNIIAMTLTKAVVLIPPAVPEGEPPMLISSIKISSEQAESVLIFTVLYPVVVMAETD